MANELKHASVGTELTQAEWESITAHVVDAQATGDMIYAASASQLRRLGIGASNTILAVSGGIPAWVETITALILTAGTAAAGTGPLKFNSGALLTTPVAGMIEFLTDAFYGTITTGPTRQTFAMLEKAQTWTAIQDFSVAIKSTAHADIGDDTNYIGSVYMGYAQVGTALTAISGSRLYVQNTMKLQASAGVVGYSVVNTDFTLGSAGTIKIPVADMAGAANDAARDVLAGNISGAICADAAGGFLYIRVGTAWYKVALVVA